MNTNLDNRRERDLVCPRCGTRDTAPLSWPNPPCSNGCGAQMKTVDVLAMHQLAGKQSRHA